MWTLTIEDDEGATRELDLVRDGYTIGRDGACDVFLPERNVSRRHARLERGADGRWWLTDLGAPYGSFINGQRVVGRAALAPGDLAQVGDHWLGLVNDAPGAESVRAGVESQQPSAPWGVRAEPDRLLVFGGPDDGRRVRVDAGPVSFGVGEGVTVRLPEGAAPAGVHALLRPLPQGHYELVRRSKTIALRVRLQLTERALLHDGDLVHFERPDQSEALAMRFLSAQQVRHSTSTPFADSGEGVGPGKGRRLDPATLPTFEAVKERLAGLPAWWRLEGESVAPRPEGYRAPPVRLTDVTSEPAPVPPPAAVTLPAPAPSPDGAEPVPPAPAAATPAPEPRRRAGWWAAAAALLALVGGAWALAGRTGGPGAVRGDTGGAAGTPSGAVVTATAPSRSTGAVDVTDAAHAAPEVAGSEEADVANDPPTALPAANRASTSAARSPGSPRVGGPTRRSESAVPGGTPPERLRAMCRADAERIARGEASPDIVQLHRARCP